METTSDPLSWRQRVDDDDDDNFEDDGDFDGDDFDGDDNVDPSHPHTEGGPSLGLHDDETIFVRRR